MNQIYNLFKIKNFELRINLVLFTIALIVIRLFYALLRLKNEVDSKKTVENKAYVSRFQKFFTFEFRVNHIVILFTTLFWNNHELFLVIAFQKVIQLINSKRMNMTISFIVA